MPKLSRNIWLSSKDYVFIVLGLCIYAFGFTAFVLPEKVVIGGLVGVGSLVYFLTDIPVAITSYACNLLQSPTGLWGVSLWCAQCSAPRC